MIAQFKSRRPHAARNPQDVRFKHQGPTASDLLGPVGVGHAKTLANRDRAKQRAALAQALIINPKEDAASPDLIARLGEDLCIKYRVLPWRVVSGETIILAEKPEHFIRLHDMLRSVFGPVRFARITDTDLDWALETICHHTLMASAEQRTPNRESCRAWSAPKARNFGLAAICTILACAIIWPRMTFAVIVGWTIFALVLQTLLKLTAALLHLRDPLEPEAVAANPEPAHLPVVTILVPLFHERDIAHTLVDRLSRLDYPADKLDICLVVEADDGLTCAALKHTNLPDTMRAVFVPLGTLQTKPRAMNYALNFARGSIIGVYDAEDRPAPDQIHRIVARFAQRDQTVACLQGRLDYYNTHSNWLSRCFTIEYATWFRIMLPGLEKLSLPIPLGGTTLFFRRDILEDLGGWDAHNVTEDADLGIRLARHGYRTEIIDTITEEEANARAWPWIKQRSRWLKGYAITYAVHMRNPVQLWRDLGAWKFFGMQLLFAGTLTQILLAPLLWSFWLVLFGLPHPMIGLAPQSVMLAIAALFLATEILTITVSMIAVRAAGKSDLIKWAPTMALYYPLAVVAAYKGILELARDPFYWDKTAHGIFAPTAPPRRAKKTKEVEAVPIQPPRPPRHPVAAE